MPPISLIFLRDYDNTPVSTYSTYRVNAPASSWSSDTVINTSLSAVSLIKLADLKAASSMLVS